MKRLMLTLILCLANTSQATIKIAVIDTGFDQSSTWSNAHNIGLSKPKLCSSGHYDFVLNNTDTIDNHGHGTHIAGLIAKGNDKIDYCLVILKYFDPKVPQTDNLRNSIQAYKKAIELGVDIINYSGGGTERSEEECTLMKQALDKGIRVVAAAGNERSNLDLHPYYPALCDSRIEVVASTDATGERLPSSNWSAEKYSITYKLGQNILSLLPHDSFGYMTGTSQATAMVTSLIVKQIDELNKFYRDGAAKCPESFVEKLVCDMHKSKVRSCQ